MRAFLSADISCTGLYEGPTWSRADNTRSWTVKYVICSSTHLGVVARYKRFRNNYLYHKDVFLKWFDKDNDNLNHITYCSGENPLVYMVK